MKFQIENPVAQQAVITLKSNLRQLYKVKTLKDFVAKYTEITKQANTTLTTELEEALPERHLIDGIFDKLNRIYSDINDMADDLEGAVDELREITRTTKKIPQDQLGTTLAALDSLVRDMQSFFNGDDHVTNAMETTDALKAEFDALYQQKLFGVKVKRGKKGRVHLKKMKKSTKRGLKKPSLVKALRRL